MNITDDNAFPVDVELRRKWVELHRQTGSHIERGGRFASLETALLFDHELSRRLHPETRKFAICLSSRLQGRSSRIEASEADIARWGIDAGATVPEGPKIYRQPWGVLIAQLEQEGIVEDPHSRPKAKREIYLRLASVRTNRRQGKPLERPTEILKAEGIPTAVVPSRYFDGPIVGELGIDEFFVLMCLHALTDIDAWGGADPAHMRVEGGAMVVSRDLQAVLGLGAAEVFPAVLALEERDLVRFTPVVWREIKLPSAAPAYEWLGDDASEEADCFVVRPTVVPGKAERTPKDRRDWHEDDVPTFAVEVTSNDVSNVAVTVGELVSVPQYESGSGVSGDRIAASAKSQIRKALPDLGLTKVSISLEVWNDSPQALVHVYKVVSDALKETIITDDSNFVVENTEVLRGAPDDDGRPYVRVQATRPNDDSIEFNRKIYVRPAEWRPNSQRRISLLTAWVSYNDYIRSLQQTVDGMPAPMLDVGALESEEYELHVHVQAPQNRRFDPDNVALFGCDLLTLWLEGRGGPGPVDSLVQRILITHGEGSPSVTLELVHA